MKQLLFTLMLFVVVLSPLAAACQALPDAPAPQASAPAAPDPAWMRIEQLANGEPIVVTSDYGPPMHCRFAGATDDFLFCDAPDSPAGTGYRFDRAQVISVDKDRIAPPQHDHIKPPGLLIAMVIGGVVTGVWAASRSGDPAGSFVFGLLGAGIVGGIGYPIASFQSRSPGASVVFRPHRIHRRLPGMPVMPLLLLPHR